MKITNELRTYVQREVQKLIPEPLSKEDSDKVYDALAKLNTDYSKFIEQKTQEFIDEAFKNPIFEKCHIGPSRYRITPLDTGVGESPAVLQYDADSKECNEYREKVESKIFAILSVQKEIDNLDSFIYDTVINMK